MFKNQQIAAAGNPAIPGLAMYAAAEETEKAQANNALNGNYAHDKPTLELLKQEITKGIALNQANLKAVSLHEYHHQLAIFADEIVTGCIRMRSHPRVPTRERDGCLDVPYTHRMSKVKCRNNATQPQPAVKKLYYNVPNG